MRKFKLVVAVLLAAGVSYGAQCGVRPEDIATGLTYARCAFGHLPQCDDAPSVVACIVEEAWACANAVGLGERIQLSGEYTPWRAVGSEAMVGERAVCSMAIAETCASRPDCSSGDRLCAAEQAGRCLAAACAP